MQQIQFKRSSRFQTLNQRDAARHQKRLDRQASLRLKLVDLNLFKEGLGPKSCCRNKCLNKLDLKLLEDFRQEYLDILQLKDQKVFIAQHFRDDECPSGFSMR